MDISAAANTFSQVTALYRNDPVTPVVTEHSPSEEANAAKPQLTADEALGSLIDMCVRVVLL